MNIDNMTRPQLIASLKESHALLDLLEQWHVLNECEFDPDCRECGVFTHYRKVSV